MWITGKRAFARAIEIALIVLMALAAVLTVTLPWSIPLVTIHRPGTDGWYEKYLLVLAVSGVLAELILWQAHGLMRNVIHSRAFSANTVRRLRVMGGLCLVQAAFYFVAVFTVTRFFMVAVFVTFAVVGLVLLVLAELFAQAVAYKNENDRTV
ncbi:MAG: DUF2975 domain-containing protein [Acutalibacteraceae bacterium]|jgi:hypothetical protein